jgi:hypothetical protein
LILLQTVSGIFVALRKEQSNGSQVKREKISILAGAFVFGWHAVAQAQVWVGNWMSTNSLTEP